ncbi:hypothetical protein Pcinc_044120 [Petrolisthes cinctipes]|uniref:C2H2-type domain-containing protein n=1 Tax=Petrolisthes cinctipes TaxID=88211 RepID=A0AAE1BEF1_PETCI|nr:hypothetical protein Pcinc_044120 [Petrolisthes cinctipes]
MDSNKQQCVVETLSTIDQFLQEARETKVLEYHSFTYQVPKDVAETSAAAYLIIVEKLTDKLKAILDPIKSDDKRASLSALTLRPDNSSDNESCEESTNTITCANGNENLGTQLMTSSSYPLSTKTSSPTLTTLVSEEGNDNTGDMVPLPTTIVTSLPSSETTVLPPSFSDTFSAAVNPSPAMSNTLPVPSDMLDVSLSVEQLTTTGQTRQQENTNPSQTTKCIKCGGELLQESEAAYVISSSLTDNCPHCSSIADSVSKRRRRKQETREPIITSTANEEETKTPDTPQGKKHSCDKCGRIFSKWKHLSIHYTKVHLDEDGGEGGSNEVLSGNNTLPLYCCKTCNLACLSLHRFNTHTCRLPTDDDNVLSSLSNRILITNVLKLHKLRKFVCETCGVEYRTFKRITYHLPRCSPGPYPCNVCSILFPTQKELNYHKKKMHKDEKCFICEECGKSFQRRTSLQKHAINWHESSSALGPFKCDICPKKFIRRIYLTNHKLRMHGLDKKFLCQMCGNKFMTQNSLMTHMEVHSDQKRFECTFCKKKFKRKEKLKYHERIHTGERPFQCHLCARGFVSKTKLDVHLSRHRGDRRYRCTYCTKIYAGAWDLKQHVRKVHDKQCDKVAVTIVLPSPNTTTTGTTTTTTTLTQVEVLDPLALATAASGLKEEEDVTTFPQVTQCPTTASPTLQEVRHTVGTGGLVSGTQYITMSGQPTVTIPVVGSMQAHLPAISHVVQVSGSSVPLTGVGSTIGTGQAAVQAVQTMQAVQAIPGVAAATAGAAAEYSIQALPPGAPPTTPHQATVHATQGYIFAQGFDMCLSPSLQFSTANADTNTDSLAQFIRLYSCGFTSSEDLQVCCPTTSIPLIDAADPRINT